MGNTFIPLGSNSARIFAIGSSPSSAYIASILFAAITCGQCAISTLYASNSLLMA